MNDAIVKTTKLSWNSQRDIIKEDEYIMGSNDSDIFSPAFPSNKIFIGIMVKPDAIVVREDLYSGPGHEVGIWASVPMSCVIELKVQFDAVRDFKDDGDQIVNVYVKPSNKCSTRVIDDYKETITVLVIDVTTGRCTSRGDPHYNSYDGRNFDNYLAGDFVLHRSQNRSFEVHTRTWKCWDASCNCGVVVRENDDIVGVTRCHGRWGKAAPKVINFSYGKFADGISISIDHSGRRFVIYTPSGSRVVAKTSKWGMDIQLTVPGDDFGGNCRSLWSV
ncbi:von Willebrand factor D and EGF domain-containing protein-like [Ptychodera flava]|uniref:von Willebrand factor D and EGF domain-containing protein-like n=1 Tax=Ptychodera flava TaxID=63121 RepID=UPI00396A1F39